MSLKNRVFLSFIVLILILIGHQYKVQNEPYTPDVLKPQDPNSYYCHSRLVNDLTQGDLKSTFIDYKNKTHLEKSLFYILLSLELEGNSYSSNKKAIIEYMDYVQHLPIDQLKKVQQLESSIEHNIDLKNKDTFILIEKIYNHYCAKKI